MVSNSVSLGPLETRTLVWEDEQTRHDNFGVALPATGVPPWQWTEVTPAPESASLRTGIARWLRWGALGLVVAAGASGAVAAVAIVTADGASATPADSARLAPIVVPAALEVAPSDAAVAPTTGVATTSAAVVVSPDSVIARLGGSLVIEEPGFLEAAEIAAPAEDAAAEVDVADDVSLTHVVARGDTLSELAATYTVTLSELRDANGLTASSVIRVGDELLIP